jgi:hypothetical protein
VATNNSASRQKFGEYLEAEGQNFSRELLEKTRAITGCSKTFRRQNNREGLERQQTEGSVHLGLQFRRCLAGAASVGARWSFI